MSTLKSVIKFSDELPNSKDFNSDSLFIVDRRLQKKMKPWLKAFPRIYFVTAGESLKDVEAFPQHIKTISRICQNSSRALQIVGIGGGSVTDFAGFVASVFKRGVELHLIPSTWLAAIDSAHGGKTALNVSGVKNQIGTFYQAERIYLVKSLLMAQPEERAQEAWGELVKIAFISGKPWANKLLEAPSISSDTFWKNLKPAINAKYEVVKKDPFELSGERHILNLGHTVGHVLESQRKIPHGEAVALGLAFACRWSASRGFLTATKLKQIQSVLPQRPFKAISKNKFRTDLRKDKKARDNNKIRFVFLKDLGSAFCEEVSVEAIVNEATQQGLVCP